MPIKKKKKRTRIVVGTNSLTEMQYPAYTNHCQFWFRLGRSYPEVDFIISNPARMSIDRMRNMTARVALEASADYILFLDDDVIVNPNYGLKQLLDCKADVAAGKICVRGYPFDYMSFSRDKEQGLVIDKELPRTGIVNKEAVGFSFALLKVEPLSHLREPYFMTGPNFTEDVYYCIKLKQLNPDAKICINCECECGHILWPEVIHEANRDAYKKYFEMLNKVTPVDKNGPGLSASSVNRKDRDAEYLAMVKHETKSRKRA